MSSADDFQVQNEYRYSRKSYKKNRRACQEDSGREESTDVADQSPRNRCETYLESGAPGCTCDLENKGDIASILHKKCPVISLAQQQLQRLLEGTDRLLCDNTRCCRSVYDFFCICKDMLMSQHRAKFALVVLIGVGFCLGVVTGAASCGTYLGRFNSPILTCIDSYFQHDSFSNIQDSFHSIT